MLLLTVVSMAALAVLAPSVQGQVLAFGACPTVAAAALTNVQLTALIAAGNPAGTWYQYKKYSSLFDGGITCTSFTFGALANNRVPITKRSYNTLKSRYTSASGSALWLTPNTLGQFALSFPQDDNGAETPFWIIGTDQATWASIWSCTNVLGGLFNLQNAWVLTNTATPAAPTITTADAAFTTARISLSPFALTTQTGCPP